MVKKENKSKNKKIKASPVQKAGLKNYQKLVLSIIICVLVGVFGSIFTNSSVDTWYPTLIKPSFNPPNWLFGPVWTTLYILMGISFYLVWKEEKTVKDDEKIPAYNWFFIQLFLNFLWSGLFFCLKSPGLAFVEIVVLWSAILITKMKFYKISKTAAYLMIPYLLWVTFAALLNFAIFYLN